jgi:hypothetical protein
MAGKGKNDGISEAGPSGRRQRDGVQGAVGGRNRGKGGRVRGGTGVRRGSDELHVDRRGEVRHPDEARDDEFGEHPLSFFVEGMKPSTRTAVRKGLLGVAKLCQYIAKEIV